MKGVILQAVFLLLCCAQIRAQNRTITGRVVDAEKEVLVGVTVTVKGTQTQVQTDSDGRFKISIPTSGSITIVARYLGYKPAETVVTNQKDLSITLLEDEASMLKEVQVVNIGYATVSKDAVTGSVSSVSARDLKDFPVATAAEALAGKLAGVSVIASEGKPGAEITIRVRGGGSITGDNSPLYIVDGVQVENALSVISPQEIQSIDVLKDVASTAIYGARGANGVVIITTKSGKNARTTVSLNVFGGVRKITNQLDVMLPYDFVMYQYQLYNNNTDQTTKDGFVKTYGAFDDLDIYKNIPFSDWQDRVFGQDAWSHTENLTITGGSKTSNYNLNVNNYKENGIMLNSGAKRTYMSFRFDNTASDKFRVGFNARYSRQLVWGAGTSNSGSQSNNSLRNAVRYRPYDEPGQETFVDDFDPNYAQQTNLINPVLGAASVTKNDYNNQFITSGYAQYSFVKGLTLRTLVGVTVTDRRNDQYNSSVTGIARQNSNLPVVSLANGSTLAIINTNTLAYDFKINKDHSFNFLVGQEINQSKVRNYGATIKWLPVDLTPEQALAGIQKATPPNGAVQDAPTTSEGQTRLFSLFGRASYNYKDRYLASFIIRNDASSLFANGYRSAMFPSGQVAWRVSREDFFKKLDLNWFNDFKIRASYGAGGNNRINADQWTTLFLGGSNYGYAVGDAVTPGFAPNVLPNPIIRWETTISRNLGLDFAFFKNRLNATIDFYSNNTKDLLLTAKVPPTTGWDSQQQNIGKTSNKGIEVQLSGLAVENKNFSYNISANVAFNKNNIVSLGLDQYGNPNNSYPASSGGINGLDFLVQVGGPVGQYYGYISDGRYEIKDFDVTYNATANTYSYKLKPGIPNSREVALGSKDPQPGDMKLKKLSNTAGDLITEADKTVLGNAFPSFAGGINQQFRYKNFDLSVFMNFSVGNETYNANKTEFTGQYLYKDNNMLADVANRWRWFDDKGQKVTEPNQLAEMNKNTSFWTPAGGQYILTSYAIEDGSFLRISNITLGYSLPQSLLNRTKVFSRFRVYATVNNLYTFTKYSGYDPEANTRRSPLTPGVDYAAYPRSRFLLAGLEVSF
ncbi:SusC/RagA family TonB-linked outer membrane protein [Pedobacter xixiisoli]|uniref:TonB-linked outer membrane protein, SusC/RagA family n=1 Tax=Pedobacter xixiisoli TaxID=1476464 RepID=A0A285ZR90_9SPHI|nr:TonB-dependent receptor [Pedobacter xixiisoli]SOD12142.1 TonB-linked outer membrane protein, SusC/RagA family [Pedobacter xixiisoli]